MARPSLAVIAARKQSFIQAGTDLDSLLRLLKRESDVAVRSLIELMTSSKDEKVVLAASQALLRFQIEVSNEAEKRQITRLIASIKYPNNNLHGTTADDDENVPLLDFETIREPD